MACNEYGWWYYRNGNIDWTYTGMACNEYGWWYYTNGQLDWTYTGMACNEYGWWYYTNGQLDWTYTGMACNEYGWWYYRNGNIDWTYTGMANNEYGTWLYNNGNIAWWYTGVYNYNNETYWVENGKVRPLTYPSADGGITPDWPTESTDIPDDTTIPNSDSQNDYLWGLHIVTDENGVEWLYLNNDLEDDYSGVWHDDDDTSWYIENGKVVSKETDAEKRARYYAMWAATNPPEGYEIEEYDEMWLDQYTRYPEDLPSWHQESVEIDSRPYHGSYNTIEEYIEDNPCGRPYLRVASHDGYYKDEWHGEWIPDEYEYVHYTREEYFNTFGYELDENLGGAFVQTQVPGTGCYSKTEGHWEKVWIDTYVLEYYE